MSLKSLATSLLILPIISTAALAENGHNWDGIYLGAVIGLQSSKINGATMTGASPTSTDLSGVSGGLTAGVNFTNNNFLYGMEADISASGVKGNVACTATQTCTNKENWNSTIRGRVGVINDKTLFFATSGVAFLSGRSTTTPATVGTTGSHTSTFTGWAASVGVEVATSAKTRLKFEYLYTDFGSSTAPAGSVGSVAYVGKLKSNQIRIGINRSF